jgi:hypothetical protein
MVTVYTRFLQGTPTSLIYIYISDSLTYTRFLQGTPTSLLLYIHQQFSYLYTIPARHSHFPSSTYTPAILLLIHNSCQALPLPFFYIYTSDSLYLYKIPARHSHFPSSTYTPAILFTYTRFLPGTPTSLLLHIHQRFSYIYMIRPRHSPFPGLYIHEWPTSLDYTIIISSVSYIYVFSQACSCSDVDTFMILGRFPVCTNCWLEYQHTFTQISEHIL